MKIVEKENLIGEKAFAKKVNSRKSFGELWDFYLGNFLEIKVLLGYLSSDF